MVNFDYLYNPEAAKALFGKSYFVDKKLGFQVIEQGTILPHKRTAPPGKWSWGAGGIVNSNGTYIKGSFINRFAGEAYTPPPNQFNIALKP